MKPLAVIPAYSHIDWRLHECLRALDIPILHLHGCSDLPKARSILLSSALESKADLFVLIDSDIVPTTEQVEMLVTSPKLGAHGAVTGAYLNRGRAFAFQPLDRQKEFELHSSPRFVECFAAGLGFAAVHRATLETFRATLPTIADGVDSWYPFSIPRVFQDREITAGRTVYLSEDYAFWYDLRTVTKSQLWLDTHIAVSHLTTAPLVVEEGMRVSPA